MSGFQAREGFVHFVYANREDTYLLPGLLQQDLDGWLYCRLKQEGYEAVLKLSGGEEAYFLSPLDQPSRELYQKYGRKNKGFMGLFGAEEESEEGPYPMNGAAECIRRCQAMLKKGRGVAVMLPLETFLELLTGQPQELEELCRAGLKHPEANENILVLQMPMPAGEKPAPKQGAGLWQLLTEHMEERTLVLSSFDLEQLLPVARRIYLTCHFEWDWQDRDVQELAAFLRDWYASEALRQQTGPLLSENPDRKFSVLLRELTDPNIRQRLRLAMELQKLRAEEKSAETP